MSLNTPSAGKHMRDIPTKCTAIGAAIGVLLLWVAGVQGVNIEVVPICDLGNEGELSGQGAGGMGPDRICGSVNYIYEIGKFEVTAGQYTEFLNAVAKTDTYNLYDQGMWSQQDGCRIEQTGNLGSYSYSVAAGYADRPVNYVSWGDAARFVNWLHNGQPGLINPVPQDNNSTEDGSYLLSGATSDGALLLVVRKPNATWVIPTEDEWYKAAYYKGGSANAGYWDYATQSCIPPTPELPPGGSNSANYRSVVGETTCVAAYQLSPSAYQTFDQNGNVNEWNESLIDVPGDNKYRGLRGGSWCLDEGYLAASCRNTYHPATGSPQVGFRVAMVQPFSEDCNNNGIPDECDISSGRSQDCNANGVPDECDIASGTSQDCNSNGIPDECDISSAHSRDGNGNGVPDECDLVTIGQWRSVRSHSGIGELPITLNATRSGNGSTGPTAETRGTAGMGMGVRKIQVDFDGPVTLANPGNVSVHYWLTSGGVMGSQQSYTPTVTMLDDTTMNILLTGAPDEACYTVTIGAGTIFENLIGDADCMVRALVGDGNGSGDITLADALLAKSKVGQSAGLYPHLDYNLGGTLTLADGLMAKSRVGKKALCP